MSYLTDTHCHLHDPEFFTPEQQAAALEKAAANNVMRIICIGTDVADSRRARDFAVAHPNTYWTYGVHPENATAEAASDHAAELAKLTADGARPIAIGEVGLDYHVEGYDRATQIRMFEEMLQLASDERLPVSFHIREAYDDFFPVVANFPTVTGVVHCFTDSKKNLKRVLNETGYYVAVNGLATYATLATPPLSRILLETDAPFLTPVPFRGIINESAYIRNIAEWLSGKLGIAFELIEHETSKNAEKLFRFPDTLVRARHDV